ncbi:MAG: sugar transferase [Patescibacteria group bacterium]|jgi:exopolysaccharide biosynthesis polyprenyl glycosylphosphotransferase
MKRSELIFSFLLVPLDFLMIIAAGLSAYSIRYAEFFTEIRPVIFNLPFDKYLRVMTPIALAWIVIFALAGLYRIKGKRGFGKEFYRIILACSTGFMLIVFLIFFRRELFDSRFIVLAGWIFSIVYITLARKIVRAAQNFLYRFGIGAHNLVIIGAAKTTDILADEFSSDKKSGYAVVARFRGFGEKEAAALKELLKKNGVDEIIQGDPNLEKDEVIRLYDFAGEHHLTFKYAADLLGAKVLKTEVTDISGIPVVEVVKTPLEGWGRIVKRTFDIVLTIFLLIILSPLFLLIAIIIKFDSRGPVFYLDYRSGQYGHKFLFYKFRSMRADLCDGEGPTATCEGNEYLNKLINDPERNTRQEGPLHKIKDDPRVTRTGKFLRRWSLDELPQFFNVLIGDISLVGPRCHMTLETAKYESRHKYILAIKPGITGLAQISGRSDLFFEDEIKLDAYYIENWSLSLDLSILFRTPLAIIRPRKAE